MSYVPAVIALMLIYLGSLVGLTTPHQQEWFLNYVPFFFWTNAFFLFVYHKKWDQSTVVFILGSFGIGLLVELLAVHTKIVFGAYNFGPSMGTRIIEVPLVMAAYWFILSYSAACLSAKLPFKHLLIQSGIGAALMVCLSCLIQQVATRLDFWHLTPAAFVQYCLVWYVVGFGLQLFFHKLKVDVKNPMAVYVYGGLVVGFVGLVMFLPS